MKKHTSLLLIISLLFSQNSYVFASPINTHGDLDPRKWSVTTGWASAALGTGLACLAGTVAGGKAFDYAQGRVNKFRANGFGNLAAEGQSFLDNHPRGSWSWGAGLVAAPLALGYLVTHMPGWKYWVAKNYYLHDDVLNHQIALAPATTELNVISRFAQAVPCDGRRDIFDNDFMRLEVAKKLGDLRAKTAKGLSLLADIELSSKPESLPADFLNLKARAQQAHQNIGIACAVMKLGPGYLNERNTAAHERTAHASERHAAASQMNARVNTGNLILRFINSFGTRSFQAGIRNIKTSAVVAGISALAFYRWALPFFKCLV